MQCFRLPISICDDIVRMTRSFWWGQKEGERKVAWKAWDDMCLPKHRGGLGFRNISLFNQARLAKQCWRLIQKPTSLVARILHGKYFPNGSFMEAREGHRPSYIWRSLLHGRSLLEKGLIWRVGDGRKIKVWSDPWLPLPTTFKAAIFNQQLLPDATVRDLIDIDRGCWKLDMLEGLFLPHEVDAILSIPLGPLQSDDKLTWHYDTKGTYSVRSGYKIAFQEWLGERSNASSSTMTCDWKCLWRLNLPPRLRVFAWRAATCSLPIGDNLRKRKISDGICSICRGAIETDRHCFFECPWTTRVWQIAGHGHRWFRRHATSMKHLILDVLGDSIQEGGLFVATLWTIWNARNRAIFDQKPIIISQVVSDAMGIVEEFDAAMERLRPPERETDMEVYRWKPPEHGEVKVNVDAAVHDLQGAVGVIARTLHGHIIYSSSVYIGRVASVEEAELRAIYHGTKAAMELNCASIVLESDSQLAIHRLHSTAEDLSSLGLLVSEIARISLGLPRCQFRFIRRSGNMPAHLLAKLSLSAKSSTVWGEYPPPQIVSAAIADYQHE